jgi:Rod binding domain-containing protein
MAVPDSLSAGLKILPPGGPAAPGPSPAASAAAAKTAQDFEAMVLSEFISSMFTTQQKGMFSPGQAGEIYRSMLTQEYGKAFAKAGGVGIAQQVQREILKLQEVQKK